MNLKILPIVLLLPALNFSCKSSFKPVAISNNSSTTNWILSGGSPNRNNFRNRTLAPPLKNIWIYKSTSAIGPSLITADGVVYVTTLDGRLDAVDITSGKKIARTKTTEQHEATCVYDRGHLIIASRYGDKTLGNYDLKTGRYLWKIDASDIATEPLIKNDAVYIAALYRHIDKYDLKTGAKIWTFKTEDQHRSSPAISGNSLVVGCDNGILYALNAKTGTLKWKHKTAASIFATPIISDGSVYVGSSDSTFYSLVLLDGSVNWTFKTDSPIYQTAASNSTVVVFGGSDGQFYCLDAQTGDLQWKFTAQSVVSTAPLISGEVVYFGSLDRKYYCLNLHDGKELWSFTTFGRIRTSPILWGNYILGASEDRYLYAFAKK